MSIIKSIFDFKFYKSIYKNSGHKSFLYLIILSLLIYYIGAFVSVGKFNTIFRTEITAFINNLPEFKLQDGILQVNAEKPLVFKIYNYLFLVDSTSNKIPSEYASSGKVFLAGQKGITFKSGLSFETIKYDEIISKLKIQSIDKDKLIMLMPIIKNTILRYIIIFYIFWYIFWLPLYKIFSILFLSFIASFIDHKLKSGLTYNSIFNISIYAITLPWIIKLIYKSLGLNNYFPWYLLFILYWGTASMYAYYAIKEIVNDQDKNDTDEIKDKKLGQQKEVNEIKGFQEIEEFTIE